MLAEGRKWDYGVLLLSQKKSRCVNSWFRIDGVVLITSQVSSYHDLLQMVWRSSRLRGVCEGNLYSIWIERAAQVLESLKWSSTTVSSAFYEKLLTNCVARLTVLKFKSEFELVYGSSSIADATIVPVADTALMLTALERDLSRFYDLRSVIIISSKE